ncbi:hypothetical protein CP557_07560 [Natrinema ejinorense]|uniref:Uncharacterized protein n=1 Tax=Natrinema ejinorense TaxID=373386 RepID=A0A2A5QUE5_9EURY|nr:hypothetical protein CP557_07560 [Natrinema ejinorense]
MRRRSSMASSVATSSSSRSTPRLSQFSRRCAVFVALRTVLTPFSRSHARLICSGLAPCLAATSRISYTSSTAPRASGEYATSSTSTSSRAQKVRSSSCGSRGCISTRLAKIGFSDTSRASSRGSTLKVTFGEALVNRLRRVYLALLGVLLAAWIFRITAFAPRQDWLATAAVANIPVVVVVGVVTTFFIAVLGLALWPRERYAKREFREGDPDAWKDDR